MKALCWHGKGDVRVDNVPDPKILHPRDAIIKVTTTCICGSDLHLLDGYVPTMESGDILGHEFMGEVVELGKDVTNLSVGDRVIVPFTIACGECFFCKKGFTSCCDRSNPNEEIARKAMGHSPSGLFGYSHMLGGYPRPPFNEQSQPWPGLASKMDPKPDHGETSYKGSGRLLGRKALITGGDSGMGRAAAIAYAREGADVAINYLPAEEPDAQEVIALIKKERRIGLSIPGDLRDEDFCRQLVEQAVQGLGGLDIVVCNAGRQQAHASILDISTEQFDWTMKTNIYAPFWIIKAALPHLKPGSAIIGTTSEQAYDPSPDLYDYAQTKAATMNYVKSLAKQLGPKGIRVNGVAPGPIWTPLQISGGATQEKVKSFGHDTALKRPGQPAELASAYVQLAASDASFTTGNIYGIGGGKGQP